MDKVNKVRSGTAMMAELGKVIDETFPIDVEELADINSRCKELVEHLQEEHVPIGHLVELINKAYDINIEAHERLGAIEFLPLSQSSSRTGSQISIPISSGSSSPMKRTNPMVLDVSLLTAEKLAPQQSYFGNDQGFTFSVVKHPERLSITWPKSWGNDFLTAAINNAQHLRDIDQDPTMIDFMVCYLPSRRISIG